MDPTTPQPSQPLQPKANNPLKNYNTEAYVPERGGAVEIGASANTSGNGNVAVGGVGMADLSISANGNSGNAANLSTTVTGNAPQTHGEVLQGQLQPQVGYDGTLNQKPLEMSENGLRTQNGQKPLEKHKKRGRIIAIVAILATALILGIAVAVVWWMTNEMTDKPSDAPAGEQGDVTEEVGNGELVELALDDELVQEVYGNFDGIAKLFDGWWEFYTDNGVRDGMIPRNMMLLLAGIHLKDGICVGDYEYINEGKVTNECASGEKVRRKINEMFGEELVLTENDKIGSFCGGMVYDVDNDEFYRIGNGCGGASSARLSRVLEAAVSDSDRMYLTEKVILFDATAYYHIKDGEEDASEETTGIYDIFGEMIGRYDDPPYEEFETNDDYRQWLAENEVKITKEYGDVFRWTFVKNDDGNYVFESLEKVEE